MTPSITVTLSPACHAVDRLRRLSTAGAIDAIKAVAAEREAPGGGAGSQALMKGDVGIPPTRPVVRYRLNGRAQLHRDRCQRVFCTLADRVTFGV